MRLCSMYFTLSLFSVLGFVFLLTSCGPHTLPPGPSAPPHSPHQLVIGHITNIVGNGDVRINHISVSQGAIMYSGDHIETRGNAKVTLQLDGGRGRVLFDGNTDPVLKLLQGSLCRLYIFIDIGKMLVDTSCDTEVETGTGAVIEKVGTLFSVDVSSNATRVTVAEGMVRIRSDRGRWRRVQAGFESSAVRGRPASPPRPLGTQWMPDWTCDLDPHNCSRTPRDSSIIMPNIEGLSLRRAKRVLQDHRLGVLHIKNTKTNNPNMNNLVAAQSPSAKTSIMQHAQIELTVYRYQTPQTLMPNLNNLHLSQAQKILKEHGLRTDHVKYRDTDNKKLHDRVMRQRPQPGRPLQPSTDVRLEVYKYKMPVTRPHQLAPPRSLKVIQAQPTAIVPNLRNNTYGQAKTELQKAGLALGTVHYKPPSSGVRNGVIFHQKPAGNAKVAPGSKIDVWIYQHVVK